MVDAPSRAQAASMVQHAACMTYGANGDFSERQGVDLASVLPLDSRRVTWLDIHGMTEPSALEPFSTSLGIHPLTLEDILNTEQRPKMEDFGDYVFIDLNMLWYDSEQGVEAQQVSFILGSRYVISFQRGDVDVFAGVRERLRSGKGRLRKMGADYLAYALVDAVVDNYFLVLEKLGEEIEDIEEALIANPGRETLRGIHHLKRELLHLRKSVWPLREAVGALDRGESALIQPGTRAYLRDVYDHTIQVIDALETYRDMVSGMLDIYLSSISNRMNEVMKVLTIISTVFIPLTFLAGVYGMNFRFMPELSWRWGYPALLGIMLTVAAVMLAFFRRKKWL
ncbi:MAG: magnesium/cobalt transporter CorA [Chloroflexi bacterium]|nr:magnesium/cobalt transporter CorA [Chloroflexota bacterium]